MGAVTTNSPISVFDPLVLSSDSYVTGEEVVAFESEVASYLGVGHAIGV